MDLPTTVTNYLSPTEKAEEKPVDDAASLSVFSNLPYALFLCIVDACIEDALELTKPQTWLIGINSENEVGLMYYYAPIHRRVFQDYNHKLRYSHIQNICQTNRQTRTMVQRAFMRLPLMVITNQGSRPQLCYAWVCPDVDLFCFEIGVSACPVAERISTSWDGFRLGNFARVLDNSIQTCDKKAIMKPPTPALAELLQYVKTVKLLSTEAAQQDAGWLGNLPNLKSVQFHLHRTRVIWRLHCFLHEGITQPQTDSDCVMCSKINCIVLTLFPRHSESLISWKALAERGVHLTLDEGTAAVPGWGMGYATSAEVIVASEGFCVRVGPQK